MTITTRLYTALFGELIGRDQLGNRYFRRKGRTHGRSSSGDARKAEKRWVIYVRAGREPSTVPPEWHGWLHYSTDLPPARQKRSYYGWEKPPLPNLTGTGNEYLPPGHLEKGGVHAPTIADYEPWKPAA